MSSNKRKAAGGCSNADAGQHQLRAKLATARQQHTCSLNLCDLKIFSLPADAFAGLEVQLVYLDVSGLLSVQMFAKSVKFHLHDLSLFPPDISALSQLSRRTACLNGLAMLYIKALPQR